MNVPKTISERNEAAARELAEKLKNEGRIYDGEIILRVCRSLVGTREFVKSVLKDNTELRERLKE